MDDRALAISILKRARDILAARLAERVIQSGEEIIEDALGNSYSSEIETIHDEVGLRLTHVNAMLASLPTTTADHPPSSPRATSIVPQRAKRFPSASCPLRLRTSNPRRRVAPRMHRRHKRPARPSHFKRLSRKSPRVISTRRVNRLPCFWTSRQSRPPLHETFAERLTTQPDFLAKAMRLRGELQSGSINGALVMLWECFGLRGFESIGAWQSLKSRLVNPVSVREETMTDDR